MFIVGFFRTRNILFINIKVIMSAHGFGNISNTEELIYIC
jgi:hypothetical protein